MKHKYQLSDMCQCGHTYGDHCGGTLGQCLKNGCDCKGFKLSKASWPKWEYEDSRDCNVLCQHCGKRGGAHYGPETRCQMDKPQDDNYTVFKPVEQSGPMYTPRYPLITYEISEDALRFLSIQAGGRSGSDANGCGIVKTIWVSEPRPTELVNGVPIAGLRCVAISSDSHPAFYKNKGTVSDPDSLYVQGRTATKDGHKIFLSGMDSLTKCSIMYALQRYTQIAAETYNQAPAATAHSIMSEPATADIEAVINAAKIKESETNMATSVSVKKLAATLVARRAGLKSAIAEFNADFDARIAAAGVKLAANPNQGQVVVEFYNPEAGARVDQQYADVLAFLEMCSQENDLDTNIANSCGVNLPMMIGAGQALAAVSKSRIIMQRG